MIKWYLMSLYSMLIIFKHPLVMVMIIVSSSFFSSMMMFSMIMNQWISYILILTFLGGMMVLFMYMASLTPNEEFMSKNKMFLFTILLTMMLTNMLNEESTFSNSLSMLYSSIWTSIMYIVMIISIILVYIMIIIFEPYNPLKAKK